MSRVYTVKSNARRDAKKLGLDPEMVKAVSGGFVIDYPDTKIEKLTRPKKPPAEKKTKAPRAPKAPKAPTAPRVKREGQAKGDMLLSMLADWMPLPDLMKALGWQAHTVRGALSTAAKAKSLKIERRRVGGVTSYRAQSSLAEVAE
jgi:hypothetical protein